jgi:hypothetical protein
MIALIALLQLLAPCNTAADLPKEPSSEARRWLALAEDTKETIQKRASAVRKLRQLREEGTAPRLIDLLSGYDALTLEVIGALADLKSQKAVPVFHRILDEREVQVPGQMRVALKWAIEECRPAK